jgi:hypothetical protein
MLSGLEELEDNYGQIAFDGKKWLVRTLPSTFELTNGTHKLLALSSSYDDDNDSNK